METKSSEQSKALPYAETDVIGLSPFTRMRREKTKITVAHLPHLTLKYGAVRPEEATILCLFDGKNSFGDIVSIVSIWGDLSYQTAEATVASVMKRVSPNLDMFVNCDGNSFHPPYNIRDFVLAPEAVDLSTRLDAPLALMLQPTNTCQTDCVYCYAPRRPIAPDDQLSLARILTLLDEAVALGIYQINLCGGDGFCRPDFVEIIRACLERGMVTDISTKCSISLETAQELARMDLDYIQVSIDTFDEATGDFIYGRPGHFKRVVKTINNLVSSGVYTRTNSIITPYNLAHIPGTIEFLKNLGIREMKFAPAFMSYFINNSSCMLSFEQKRKFEEIMPGLEDEYMKQGITIFHDALKDHTEMNTDDKQEYWFHKRAYCSSGRSNLIVTPDGKAVLCEESPQEGSFIVGDLKKQGIQEVWNSSRILDFIYPAREQFLSTACYECEQFTTCVHVKGHCFKDCLKVFGKAFVTNPFCPQSTNGTIRIY